MTTTPYLYKKIQKTIREFIDEYYRIDCQPVGQRLDVTDQKLEGTSKPSKAQGIIETILRGIDIGQITIVKLSDSVEFDFESIDGGHRKRYIKMFTENKFCLFDGRKYSDLSKEERNFILNTELTFCIYDDLPVYEKGYTFRTLNLTTDVKHMEMLNSFGDIPIANAIREISRKVKGIKSKPHSLFEFTINADDVKKYPWLSFVNKRLLHDELVARIFFRYYDTNEQGETGGLGTSTDTDIEKMYSDVSLTQEKVDKMKKKVIKLLDFLEEMAYWCKRYNNRGLTQKEFNLFTRLYLYMEYEYGDYNIEEPHNFFKGVNDAFKPYMLKHEDQPAKLQKVAKLGWSNEKTRSEQMRSSLTEYRPTASVKQPVEWILEDFDIAQYVTVKDKRRLFPREMREFILSKQDYKCAIDGSKICMKTSQGAHIKAHSKGGMTTLKNLAMVATHHNKDMGSMSVTEYKQILGA